MAKFEKAFSKTMGHEGGYSNDPVDRGGETYRGVSRKNYPGWQGWVIIDRIKKSVGSRAADINKAARNDATLNRMVELFYREHFWDVNRLDEFPQIISNEIFDTGVNMGAEIGAIFLQQALNLCNDGGKHYPNIVDDGKIGPITVGTFYRAAKVGITDRLYKTMNLLQGERYLNIIRRNEMQERWWGGWLERVFH